MQEQWLSGQMTAVPIVTLFITTWMPWNKLISLMMSQAFVVAAVVCLFVK